MCWLARTPLYTGAAKADYEYNRRKLELRISDLSRYQIHAVMVESYKEITDILRELNRRAHLKHIFVSGSAHDFGPLGRERLEGFCSRLGHEIIARGFNLVSGFGRGIGGVVALGALERIYSAGLNIQRVLLFPFPQVRGGVSKDAFYAQYRASMLSNAGFVFFICGNREDPKGGATIGHGVMEEFDIACKLGKEPVPFGASGWAAENIWQKVSANPSAYYGIKDISSELKLLGEAGRSDDKYLDAMFAMVKRLSK